MARSKETFGKKEREKKRLKKRKDKQQRKEERKAQSALNKEKGIGLDDMIAYVDEFGNLTDTPPDPKNKLKIDAKKIRVSTPKMEDIELESMMEGKVEYFNQSKGFGFIKGNGSHEKYFVHIKNTDGPLQEGDKVSFEAQQGVKGMIAVNVIRL